MSIVTLFEFVPIFYQCSMGCLGLSWQCLGDFIQVWGCVIQTFWQKFELSEYVQRLPLLPNPSSAYECLYLGVSVWCLGVSGWCVRVSGDVSNQIYWENVILGHYTQILPFLPMPSICVKKRLCLGVSGWCLYVSGGV